MSAHFVLPILAVLLTVGCGGSTNDSRTGGQHSVPTAATSDAPNTTAELRFDAGSTATWLVTIELPSSWSMRVDPSALQLTLRNSTGSPVSFGDPVASCACIQGRLGSDAAGVPVGGECTVEIVPTWAWSGSYRQSLWLPAASTEFGNGVVRVDIVGEMPDGPAEDLIVPAVAWSVDGHVRLNVLVLARTGAEPSPVRFAWITETGPIAVEPVAFDGWQRLHGGDDLDSTARLLWHATVLLPEPSMGSAVLLAATNQPQNGAYPFHAAQARQIRVRRDELQSEYPGPPG